MNSVAVGPFLFSMGVLALLAAVLAAQWTASFQARGGRTDVSGTAWWLVLVTLAAARAGYVVRWWAGYAAHPWDILNVRDGGFDPVTGLLVLAGVTGVVAWRSPRRRRPLLVTVGVSVAAWGLVMLGGAQLRAAAHPSLPEAAQVRTLDGGTKHVRTWRGRPLVINFWATWCGPCRREMPVLAQAQHDFPGVRFVFADQAESADAVRAFLKAQHLQLDHVYIDDGVLARYYRVRGFPTTLFIDADGRLRTLHVGELSHASLRANLQRLAPQAVRAKP